MKLPGLDSAEISREKITGYLLSFEHRDGRGKAAFFTGFGFSPHAWESLAEAIIKHAADNDVKEMESTPFGTRYVVEGILQTPDKRNPKVRTVWFVEHNDEVPRFVTAYPLPEMK